MEERCFVLLSAAVRPLGVLESGVNSKDAETHCGVLKNGVNRPETSWVPGGWGMGMEEGILEPSTPSTLPVGTSVGGFAADAMDLLPVGVS